MAIGKQNPKLLARCWDRIAIIASRNVLLSIWRSQAESALHPAVTLAGPTSPEQAEWPVLTAEGFCPPTIVVLALLGGLSLGWSNPSNQPRRGRSLAVPCQQTYGGNLPVSPAGAPAESRWRLANIWNKNRCAFSLASPLCNPCREEASRFQLTAPLYPRQGAGPRPSRGHDWSNLNFVFSLQ